MLNKNGIRELCYVVAIDGIKPIEGRDRVECAIVGGWTIMVRKNQFKVGDYGIYFEIDSKTPEIEPFNFLASKHYKIKTQKYKTPNGQFWSQGLLMSAEDFGWKQIQDGIEDNKGKIHKINDESRFLTAALGIKYAAASDNERKANSLDKYKNMANRNKKLFSYFPFAYLMKKNWGKKLLFLFFGNKSDKKYKNWPIWVKKTDEERIQNMPWVLNNKEPFIVTEKIDGSSTTFTIKRGYFNKYNFYVCSRNVCFNTSDTKCFYDTNIYLEMAEKYNIEEVLKTMLFKDDRFADCDWITIQGETYGLGIQNRDYSIPNHDFAAFNLITSREGRLNSIVMKKYLDMYKIPSVPILNVNYILPDTVEELLKYATNSSQIDGKAREGIVLRLFDDSNFSFKAVSNEYLNKYHS